MQVGCNVVGTKKSLLNGVFFSHFGLNSGKIEGIGLICKGLKIPRLNKPYRFKSDHKHHRKSAHFECFFVILAAKTDLNKSARGRMPEAMPREHRAALPRLRALRGNGRWDPFRGFGISLIEKREKFTAISPVLLCLGRDWVANFCRICLKISVFY